MSYLTFALLISFIYIGFKVYQKATFFEFTRVKPLLLLSVSPFSVCLDAHFTRTVSINPQLWLYSWVLFFQWQISHFVLCTGQEVKRNLPRRNRWQKKTWQGFLTIALVYPKLRKFWFHILYTLFIIMIICFTNNLFYKVLLSKVF